MGTMEAIPSVVFSPELIGRSLTDPACLRVMHFWRDGRIRPVLNRPLLRRYLQVLHGCGLPQTMVRRWLWWFTSDDKSRFLDESENGPVSGWESCVQVVQTAGAKAIVCSDDYHRKLTAHPSQYEKGVWLAATQVTGFLADLEGGGSQ